MPRESSRARPPPSLWDLDPDDRARLFDVRAPLDFTSEAFLRGEAAGAFKRISRNGARSVMGAHGGTGFFDFVRLDHGIEVQVVNYVSPAMRRRQWYPPDHVIILRASLSGDEMLKVEGAAPIHFELPELTMICLPRGTNVTLERQGGVRHQSLTGIFAPSAFAAAYGLQADDLPPAVREAAIGSRGFGRLMSLPLEHRIANLVADTIDTTLDGEMRALQYAGRLSELVAYTFDAIRSRSSEPSRSLLSWRDADLAHMVVERLARDYRQPPLVDDLAKELGASPKKLQASFKGAFGMTMVEYCLERRMREAQQLLIEAKLSVAGVAERLGYAHQSSFAAAFSGHVGMSPREYRRHRAPVDVVLR